MNSERMEELYKFMDELVGLANNHGMILVCLGGKISVRKVPDDTFIDVEWEGDHLVWNMEYIGDLNEI